MWGLPARARGCIYSVHNGEPLGVSRSHPNRRGGGDREVQGDLEVGRAGLSVGECGKEEAQHAPQFPG